jgi:hypothetical protein
LSTIVHPAAMAGATLRVIIALGKFHGVIAAQTPMGSRKHQHAIRGASGAEIVSPMTRLACSANHSTKGSAIGDLALGFSERLTLLQRHDAGEIIGIER